MNKEVGLYKRIKWSAKPPAPVTPAPAGRERKRGAAGPAAGAKTPKVPKVPPKEPCVVYLGEQLGMRHGGTAGNGAPVLCRSKKGQCPGGYHAALASMTRAQCEEVAKGCKWKLGKEFLAAVLAADARKFHK